MTVIKFNRSLAVSRLLSHCSGRVKSCDRNHMATKPTVFRYVASTEKCLLTSDIDNNHIIT